MWVLWWHPVSSVIHCEEVVWITKQVEFVIFNWIFSILVESRECFTTGSNISSVICCTTLYVTIETEFCFNLSFLWKPFHLNMKQKHLFNHGCSCFRARKKWKHLENILEKNNKNDKKNTSLEWDITSSSLWRLMESSLSLACLLVAV